MRRRKPRSEFSTSMTSFFHYDRWQPTIVSTVASTASYTYVRTTFQLSDINSTDLAYFQGLFDQYRITGIEVAFRSLTNPDASYTANSATTINANNFFMDIYAVVDNDDANTPTSIEYMQAYGKKLKMGLLKPNQWFHYSFHPKVQNLVYYTSVNSGYAVPVKNPWINCANTGVPHYALKFAIGSPFSNVQALTYEYRLRYKIQFKNNH